MKPSRREVTAALAGALGLAGCRPTTPAEPPSWPSPEVTVYVSLDEPYSRPILDAIERETGLRVRRVYDTEAAKSRGLAQRILAERMRPRADVFWSSEVLQMVRLKEEGALEPYASPSAAGIPARFHDPDGHWHGFAARFRVLAFHRDRVKDPPRSLLELTHARWSGRVAMANPLFGTTTTEAAALRQVLGPARARDYFVARARNGTQIADGNSSAVERVARGAALVCQTDTDDAFIRAGLGIEVVYPDQEGFGALLIPNTVALVRGGRNPEAARRFVDHLLRPETELALSALPARQLPLHPIPSGRLPEAVRPLRAVKAMEVDYTRLTEGFDELDRMLRELFLR